MTVPADPSVDRWAGFDAQDWDAFTARVDEQRAELANVAAVYEPNPRNGGPVGGASLGEVALFPTSELRQRIATLTPGAGGGRWVRAKDHAGRVAFNGFISLPTPQATPHAPPSPHAQPPHMLTPAAVYPPGGWPYAPPPPAAPQDLAGLVRTLLDSFGAQRSPVLGELPAWLQPIMAELFRQRSAAAEDLTSARAKAFDEGFETGRRVGRKETGKGDEEQSAFPPELVNALTSIGARLAGAKEDKPPPPPPAPPPPAVGQFNAARVLRTAIDRKLAPGDALALVESCLGADAVASLVAMRGEIAQRAARAPELAHVLTTAEGVAFVAELADELNRRAAA